ANCWAACRLTGCEPVVPVPTLELANSPITATRATATASATQIAGLRARRATLLVSGGKLPAASSSRSIAGLLQALPFQTNTSAKRMFPAQLGAYRYSFAYCIRSAADCTLPACRLLPNYARRRVARHPLAQKVVTIGSRLH